MTPDLRNTVLGILSEHRLMTLATNRPDGWPQATVVAYANDGLKLYCFVSRLGQKFSNIMRDPRVSAAIAGDFDQPLNIKGLSIAAKASVITEPGEFDRIYDIFLKRFPEYAVWPRPNSAISPMIRLAPVVLSVLDYSKGFGHSDLIKIEEGDFRAGGSHKHHWFGRTN